MCNGARWAKTSSTLTTMGTIWHRCMKKLNKLDKAELSMNKHSKCAVAYFRYLKIFTEMFFQKIIDK